MADLNHDLVSQEDVGEDEFNDDDASLLEDEEDIEEDYYAGGAYSSDESEEEDDDFDLQWDVCCVCREDRRCYTAPSQHTYCLDDLRKVILKSMNGDFPHDKRQYPPKCCQQHIPFEEIRHLLPPGLVQLFEEKEPELKDKKAVYCHQCDRYIDKSWRKYPYASCPSCPSTRTCVKCHEAAHPGHCVEDLERKKAQEEARKAGLQTCPNCQNIVEKTEGCNHIACVCGADFCYVCGKQFENDAQRCSCRME